MWSLPWRGAPPGARPAGGSPGARSAGAGRGIYGLKVAGCRGDDPTWRRGQPARNAGANTSAAHFSIDVGVVVAAERGWVALRCPSLNPFDISA